MNITADIYGARAKRNTDVAAGYITRLFSAHVRPPRPLWRSRRERMGSK